MIRGTNGVWLICTLFASRENDKSLSDLTIPPPLCRACRPTPAPPLCLTQLLFQAVRLAKLAAAPACLFGSCATGAMSRPVPWSSAVCAPRPECVVLDWRHGVGRRAGRRAPFGHCLG